MNRIEVEIKQVHSSDGIILADLEAHSCSLIALMIEATDLPVWLKAGNRVFAVFKESEVSIAKNLKGIISLRNRFPCIVVKIERGKLMSIVLLQYEHIQLSSAITTRSVDALELNIGDEVLALIKANEISLMQK
jgi:molybdate transport system regulatory protein